MASADLADGDARAAAAPDFASLRQEGLRQLERLAGPGWTDFNAHDPGITILEQVCYALTDLGYRNGHALADLLVGAQDGTDDSIPTPAVILPTQPVTTLDLRKVVIDVPGVKNAWIEVIDEPSARFDTETRELSFSAGSSDAAGAAGLSPNVSEVRVRGLLGVRIEKPDPFVFPDLGNIGVEVARRLHGCRGLGQDFAAIEVLKQQSFRLGATIEVGAVDDAATLLAGVYQRIATCLSPPVAFHTLAEMLARGRRVDEIFEGPLLDHGFIDADELAQVERLHSLRISDLIQAIMTTPGVLAVKNIHFLVGDDGALTPSKEWLRVIDADKTPWFDIKRSRIVLEKNRLQVDDRVKDSAIELYRQAMRAAGPALVAAATRDLHPPPGRNRQVANYHSVLEQFPVVYGIGPVGLPDSATPERKALARQLKAYLMFYDQLLANQFAQLANVARLFSFQDESTDSYFAQPVPDDDGTLGLEAVRRSAPAEHRRLLQRLVEDPSQDVEKAGARRRNRFLDHLLARFGEQFGDYALMQSGADAPPGTTPDEQLARDKRAFLRDCARIGRARGTAFNYLEPAGDDNVSGLELALRRKLGVHDAEERFYLVEHVLLRPLAGDTYQRAPLLRAAPARDPYSLQITLVFPDWPVRYLNRRPFVEQSVRDETPAHLHAHVVWLGRDEMRDFAAAQVLWLQQWREQRRAELGL